MATVHDAMNLYYEVRSLAIAAKIDNEKIKQANITYAKLHALIIKARYEPDSVLALQDAIMRLPMKLISDFDVATKFDDIREAILRLSTDLMDVLSVIITFENTEAR